MKTYITLVSFFLFLSAQAQYTVDWSKAPLNPIPEKYTLNHFKIVGNVSSRQDVDGNFYTFFDHEGKALTQTNQYADVKWTYDSAGHLTQMKMEGAMNGWVKYKTNEKGFITTIISDDGTTYTLNYNSEGLFVSKMEKNVPVRKYTYDEQGRITKEEFFKTGKPSSTFVYEYTETQVSFTIKEAAVIITTTDETTGKTTTKKKKFNKRGDEVFSEIGETEYKYDSQGNIISAKNLYGLTNYKYAYK